MANISQQWLISIYRVEVQRYIQIHRNDIHKEWVNMKETREEYFQYLGFTYYHRDNIPGFILHEKDMCDLTEWTVKKHVKLCKKIYHPDRYRGKDKEEEKRLNGLFNKCENIGKWFEKDPGMCLLFLLLKSLYLLNTIFLQYTAINIIDITENPACINTYLSGSLDGVA